MTTTRPRHNKTLHRVLGKRLAVTEHEEALATGLG